MFLINEEWRLRGRFIVVLISVSLGLFVDCGEADDSRGRLGLPGKGNKVFLTNEGQVLRYLLSDHADVNYEPRRYKRDAFDFGGFGSNRDYRSVDGENLDTVPWMHVLDQSWENHQPLQREKREDPCDPGGGAPYNPGPKKSDFYADSSLAWLKQSKVLFEQAQVAARQEKQREEQAANELRMKLEREKELRRIIAERERAAAAAAAATAREIARIKAKEKAEFEANVFLAKQKKKKEEHEIAILMEKRRQKMLRDEMLKQIGY